ncbi:hypothetical protein [Tamlana flava]|uniref:hypothetical protein n=1 Tax=Tamlana flava TaxID=3158572 RepID=UPI00351AFC98
MKAPKIHFKSIAIFLSLLIMLQSCSVYKSVPISIEEAVQANSKVKVYKRNGDEVKYKKIIFSNDGQYYGIEKATIFKSNNNVLINEDQIVMIRVINKEPSAIMTGLLIAFICLPFFMVAHLAY